MKTFIYVFYVLCITQFIIMIKKLIIVQRQQINFIHNHLLLYMHFFVRGGIVC